MSVLSDLSAWGIAALVAAALFVGLAKTAVSGIGAVSVALFAAVLPARESTGAILPLLMLGDVLGVALYRQHADWGLLLRLFPAVGLGVVAGFGFVAVADDTVMRRTIGVVLLVLIAVTLWTRRRPPTVDVDGDGDGDGDGGGGGGRPRVAAAGYGLLAGFTTMVANAAGPVMSLYLLAAKFDMLRFLGTMAWFFALVNLFKLPFSIGLGLVTPDSLLLNLLLAPALLVGAIFGWWIIKRIDEKLFERLIIIFTVLAGVNLLR